MTISRTIDELLELLGSQSLEDIKVGVVVDDALTLQTVAAYDNYKTRLSVLFGEANVCLKAAEDTDEAAAAAFKNLWEKHYRDATNMKQWGFLYRAITDNYNPTENYDRHSTITTDYSGKETNTVVGSVIPNDGTSDYQDATKDTADRTFDNRQDTVSDYTHGNIGVMAVPDMVEKEFAARKTDFTIYLIGTFIYTYCY